MELILGPSVDVTVSQFTFREVGEYDNAARYEVYFAGTWPGTNHEPGVLLGSVARLNVGRATWSATADQGHEAALRWVGGFSDRHAAALHLLGRQAERDWPARAVRDRLHAPLAALPVRGLGPHPADARPTWVEVSPAPWLGPLAAHEDDACGEVFDRHFTASLRDGTHAVLDVAFYAEVLPMDTATLARVCRHTSMRVCADPHDVEGSHVKHLGAWVENVPFIKEASDQAARQECERFRPDLDVRACEEVSLLTWGFRRAGTGIRGGAPVMSLTS